MPANTKKENEWYQEGLRFDCTQCGNCCTGPPGYVWFNRLEAQTMAASLGVSVEVFYEMYARREGDHWSLTERATEHGYDCVFLDRDSIPGKAICLLYGARPTQCRTWPFWRENLISPEMWERARKSTPCPGMGNGSLIPIEEVRIQRDQSAPA